MLKKGLTQSTILIVIVSLVVIALSLIFGYSSITQIGEKGNAARKINLINELKADIEKTANSPGSVIEEKYDLPNGISEICFIDRENVDTTDIIDHILIYDSVEEEVQKNVFLTTEEGTESFYIEGLGISYFPYIHCIEPKGRTFTLRLIDTGKKMNIRVPAYQEYCQNAKDVGMCDELDSLIFDTEYRQECCSEYNICC